MPFLGILPSPARAALFPHPCNRFEPIFIGSFFIFRHRARVEVMDLSTGYHVGYNAAAAMPAASTIKVPVMVEVFQPTRGRPIRPRPPRHVACERQGLWLGRALRRAGRQHVLGRRAAQQDDRHQRQHRDEHADSARRSCAASIARWSSLGLQRTRLTGYVRTELVVRAPSARIVTRRHGAFADDDGETRTRRRLVIERNDLDPGRRSDQYACFRSRYRKASRSRTRPAASSTR